MKIRVFVIVRQEKQFLLIRESNPRYRKKWHLPGGVMKGEETVVDTAIRETQEEAGYTIAINGICYIKYISRPVTEKGLYIYCMGRVLSGSIKETADEHSINSAWFDLAAVEKLELRGNVIELLYKTHETTPPLIPTDQIEISGNFI